MKIAVHTENEHFDALVEEWNALLGLSAVDTLFLTWEWQRAWWRAFGEGKQLLLLTARDDDGELMGIAPLFSCEVEVTGEPEFPELSIEHGLSGKADGTVPGLFLIGGTEVSDYLDFIIRADSLESTYAELLAFLAEEILDRRMLDLHNIPATSPTMTLVPAFARETDLLEVHRREEVCPVLELPASWDEYLSGLTKKKRHELRRKRRRLHGEVSARFRVLEDLSEFDRSMETFFRLHEQSTRDKAAFWSDRMRGFFYEVSRAALDRGWLQLSFLDVDEEPIATFLSFEHNGDHLVYNSGFDPARYGALAPGIVLASHCIEDAISRGLRRFDFLQGDERYKYDLGAVDTEVIRLVLHPYRGQT